MMDWFWVEKWAEPNFSAYYHNNTLNPIRLLFYALFFADEEISEGIQTDRPVTYTHQLGN